MTFVVCYNSDHFPSFSPPHQDQLVTITLSDGRVISASPRYEDGDFFDLAQDILERYPEISRTSEFTFYQDGEIQDKDLQVDITLSYTLNIQPWIIPLPKLGEEIISIQVRGDLLYVFQKNGNLKVFNRNTFFLVSSHVYPERILRVSYCETKKFCILTGSFFGMIIVNLGDFTFIHRDPYGERYKTALFVKDNTRIIVLTDEDLVRIFDTLSGTLLSVYMEGELEILGFSADYLSDFFVIFSEQKIKTIDFTGNVLRTFSVKFGINDVEIINSGTTLYIYSSSNNQVIDVQSQRQSPSDNPWYSETGITKNGITYCFSPHTFYHGDLDNDVSSPITVFCFTDDLRFIYTSDMEDNIILWKNQKI